MAWMHDVRKETAKYGETGIYMSDWAAGKRPVGRDRKNPMVVTECSTDLAAVVQKLNSAIYRINHYPVEKY